MKSNYKKLGGYIRQVDKRNSDARLGEDNLYGISVTKEFIISHANLVGVTFDSYKVVVPRQFAYIPDTSRRGDKIAISLNSFGEDIIVSSICSVFEIINENQLLPEYLMLWFMRPEFDRYARFMSNGSAREVFDWDCMCDVELPVPPISEQRKIVHDYQVITDRIELLRKMNENLEAQIMAIYHQTFDDVCREGVAAELGEIVGGATPSTEVSEYFCENGIVWLSPKDLTGTGLKFIFRGETDISEAGYNSCSTKMLPIGTVLLTSRAPVGTVAIAMKELCTNQGFKSIVPKTPYWTSYIYCLLKDSKQLLEANASGTTFLEISGDTLKKLVVPIPEEKLVEEFSRVCAPIFKQQMLFEQELTQLNSLVSIRVSSIAKGA